MYGEGHEQLTEAMSQILLQQNAEANFLQATEGDVNIVIPFNDHVLDVLQASDSSDAALEELYRQWRISDRRRHGHLCGGGTGLELAEGYDLSRYTPAVILMTDGQSEDHLNTLCRSTRVSVWIFRYFHHF